MQKSTTILSVCSMVDAGCSFSEIQARNHIGSSASQLIKQRYLALGVPLSQLREWSDEDIMKAFYPSKRTNQYPMPDFEAIHQKMTQKNYYTDLHTQWEIYIEKNPDGYRYTQFKKHYKDWVAENKGARNLKMAVNRKPGEYMYVDWMGDKLPLVIDPKNPSEYLEAHLFVTTVGVSSKLFIMAFPDEKVDSVAAGIVAALNYYGATPPKWRPDNMKTAVTKNTNDILLLNTVMSSLESFYDVIVSPAPKYKPKAKATVERGVKWAESYILSRLDGRKFASFEALNSQILILLEQMNNKPKGNEKRNRNEIFKEVDLPAMKPLPSDTFTTFQYSRCRVPDNYHIKFDGHYYSVPYTLYNPLKPYYVVVRATDKIVYITDERNHLICQHNRSYASNTLYIGKEEHMLSSHAFYAELNDGRHNKQYYLDWAARIGANMEKLIQINFYNFPHEEQAYKSCAGILHLCDHISNSMAEKAAAYCLEKGRTNYSGFKGALTLIRKQNGSTHADNAETNVPEHTNIRGKDYYK